MNTLQQKALLRLAHDLGRGEASVLAAMTVAIANPPRTTETVGFYVSGKENDFENCFRKLCGLIEETEYGSSVEDKYCTEIFEQWVGPGRLQQLPQALSKAIPGYDTSEDPDSGGPDSGEANAEAIANLHKYFPTVAREIEMAFAALGAPLLSLDTNGGDTLLFVNAEPDVAERWRDVELGRTHNGGILAIRSPMWHRFWDFLGYAGLFELGDPPEELRPDRELRQLSELRF
jgi:hypothetical protein